MEAEQNTEQQHKNTFKKTKYNMLMETLQLCNCT